MKLNSDTLFPPPHFKCVAKLMIQKSCFALVAIWKVPFQLQWFFQTLGWFCLCTRKGVLQDLEVLPIQKRQNLSTLLFSYLAHQYHMCRRCLAIGSTVYISFKFSSQLTSSEKLFTLMNFKKEVGQKIVIYSKHRTSSVL